MSYERIKSTNPNYEPRYWVRVWIVARALLLGWRNLPYAVVTAWGSAKELAWDLWMLVLGFILPITCFAAPLWLWLMDRDNKKMSDRRKQAAKEWINRGEE